MMVIRSQEHKLLCHDGDPMSGALTTATGGDPKSEALTTATGGDPKSEALTTLSLVVIQSQEH